MTERHYDLIGDIHGYAGELRHLLERMGYTPRGGCYQHPERRAIFLGDFIDRGPAIPETLAIVRPMVEGGAALAVLGNHEYNALLWHTPDGNGGFLRERTPKHLVQHAATMEAFKNTPALWREYLDWFRTLPLFLALPGLRVVHACWDDLQIAALCDRPMLTDELLVKSARRGSVTSKAVDVLLKGKELRLPEGYWFRDKEGSSRPEIRLRWWLDGRGKTYRDLVFPDSETVPELPLPAEGMAGLTGYPADAAPVFVGHYWMSPDKLELPALNIACLDFSVAKGGPLVAYRWDGERVLDAAKFVTSREPLDSGIGGDGPDDAQPADDNAVIAARR